MFYDMPAIGRLAGDDDDVGRFGGNEAAFYH